MIQQIYKTFTHFFSQLNNVPDHYKTTVADELGEMAITISPGFRSL